ncbi:MAG: hypothetical protein HY820_04015 [Acidobacteria bacterium]|nr:hypothetical protein [Acidobacteriota bacterium]
MNLGAEPKKLAILGGLVLVAGYSIYTNVFSEPEIPAGARQQQSSQKKSPATVTVPGLPSPPPPGQRQSDERALQRRKAFAGRESVGEFKPSLKFDKPEDRPDPLKVDPTLRLEVLAKLQKVTLEGGMRSLFEMSTAPPKPTGPEVSKIIPGKKGAAAKEVAELKPAETKAEPSTPKAPPIPLKFYGFTTPRAGGAKRAFFLEGEEIYVAAEGETIKKRYKVVRVGVNSVVMEDTQFSQQQTLPLEEPPVTG